MKLREIWDWTMDMSSAVKEQSLVIEKNAYNVAMTWPGTGSKQWNPEFQKREKQRKAEWSGAARSQESCLQRKGSCCSNNNYGVFPSIWSTFLIMEKQTYKFLANVQFEQHKVLSHCGNFTVLKVILENELLINKRWIGYLS